MELEERVATLETTIARLTEQRALTMFEVFALRAILIAMTPLISTSSDARYAVVKDRAMDRLASYLLAGEFPAADSEAMAHA